MEQALRLQSASQLWWLPQNDGHAIVSARHPAMTARRMGVARIAARRRRSEEARGGRRPICLEVIEIERVAHQTRSAPRQMCRRREKKRSGGGGWLARVCADVDVRVVAQSNARLCVGCRRKRGASEARETDAPAAYLLLESFIITTRTGSFFSLGSQEKKGCLPSYSRHPDAQHRGRELFAALASAKGARRLRAWLQ